MSRTASVSRLAKSAGLDPIDVAVALLERGVEIDDPDAAIDGEARKAARAVIREMLGGPKLVKSKVTSETTVVLEPAERSPALIGTLSTADVLLIHDRLCADFGASDDPIFPPGLRSEALLDSAVSRQESGFGGVLKYHDPILNAATLLYGICHDHPFHNGNKRTALVCALAHFDRNRLILETTKQRDLLQLMISIADHKIVQSAVKIGRDTTRLPRRGTPDEEVAAIAAWFEPRVVKMTRGEASVTYRELRQLLSNYDFSIHPLRNQKIAICKSETRRKLFRTSTERKTLMALEWPGDGRTVSVGTIKHIRRTLELCEENGVTREAFYEKGVRVDRFINDYRLVLRRLASR